MEFKGKISSISEVKTGTSANGNEWASVDIEVTESNPRNEKYPQIGGFSWFKSGEYKGIVEKINDSFKLNDEINVEFNLSMSEYEKKDGSGKGKFYKNSVWKIEKSEGETSSPAPSMEQVDNDLPF